MKKIIRKINCNSNKIAVIIFIIIIICILLIIFSVIRNKKNNETTGVYMDPTIEERVASLELRIGDYEGENVKGSVVKDLLNEIIALKINYDEDTDIQIKYNGMVCADNTLMNIRKEIISEKLYSVEYLRDETVYNRIYQINIDYIENNNIQ